MRRPQIGKRLKKKKILGTNLDTYQIIWASVSPFIALSMAWKTCRKRHTSSASIFVCRQSAFSLFRCDSLVVTATSTPSSASCIWNIPSLAPLWNRAYWYRSQASWSCDYEKEGISMVKSMLTVLCNIIAKYTRGVGCRNIITAYSTFFVVDASTLLLPSATRWRCTSPLFCAMRALCDETIEAST